MAIVHDCSLDSATPAPRSMAPAGTPPMTVSTTSIVTVWGAVLPALNVSFLVKSSATFSCT